MPETKRTKKKPTPAARARKDAADARREKRKRRRRIFYASAAVLIGLITVIGFTIPEITGLFQRSPEASPGQSVAIMTDSKPVAVGASHSAYATTPPTSGPYYDVPAQWGVVDTEVADEIAVRDLHQAGVVVSYNLTDQAQIDRLKTIVQSYPNTCYLLMRPYKPEGFAPGTIALTAWGAMDTMSTLDEARIRKFIDYYRGNGGWVQDQTVPAPQAKRNAPEKPACP